MSSEGHAWSSNTRVVLLREFMVPRNRCAASADREQGQCFDGPEPHYLARNKHERALASLAHAKMELCVASVVFPMYARHCSSKRRPFTVVLLISARSSSCRRRFGDGQLFTRAAEVMPTPAIEAPM